MTSIETGPSWVERLNPRHWTLVWKLVIVGLVPALLALALGVLRIADQAGSAADLGRSGRLLEARNEIVAAAGALRLERDQATLYAASNGNGDRGALDSSRQRSDQALDTMRSGLAASTADLEPATVAALQRTEDSLDLVSSLRQTVTGTPSAPYDQVVNRYTNVIGTIDVLDRAILRQQRTQATAGLADASSAVTSASEQLSIQHAILSGAIRAGKPLPGDAAVVNAATAQLVNNYRDYQAALTPEQLAKFGNLPDTSATSRMDQLRSAILTAPFQLNPLAKDWDTAYDQARESTDRTAGLISAELSATAAAAAQRASNLAGINSVILMLGLLVGIAIAVLVARSLIRSLRLLRSSALDVAERRLPQAVESMRAGETPDVAVEPVPIGTRDEVGQVARAFDAVHGQAVRLAAEQASLQANVSAMFINLSRRSQALVERQLQLIEALESNEQDADQLSNLFQLDHLATRMRRNSENLLVLAGTDLAKRNMAPVPVVDVLRAAVSEVEQYQRVVVQAPPAASLAGRAGSDVVHLLAELLDNATAFSPPESQVVMSTTRSPDGAIVIEISDRGVGMADDELADANTRLIGPSGVDVSASRRMGLFVVGRLAARHGIGVRLSSTAAGPGSGLTASVSVPPSLIPTGVPADAPRPAGVPMPAGVPAQGRPAEARPTWPDANGARPTPLSALVTGADAPGNAPSAAREASPTGGQSTLFPGKPPVNGNTTHGLPTRRPGSSLRPDGPPPTEAPPGGFFDDGPSGEGGRGEGGRGERPPGEQARLDQEAAARRDRMGGGPGLTAVPPLDQPRDDERSVSDDERSGSDEGPADRPRLTKNFTESGERPGPGRSEPSGLGAGRSDADDDTAGPETARFEALPDTRRPDTGKPRTGWLGAGRTDGDRTDADRPDAERTDADRADTGRSDFGRTDADRSDADRTGVSRTDTGESGSGRTDTGRTDAGESDAARTDAADRPSTEGSRPDGSEPHDRRPAAWRTGPSGPETGSPRDADTGDDSRPGERTGLGIAGATGAAAGAAAAGMAAGHTAATTGPDAVDRGPAARPGTPTPFGSTPSGETPASATPFGRYPSGATPSGGFPSSTNPSDAGQTGTGPSGASQTDSRQTGGFRPGTRPSGAGQTGEFPAGARPSGAGQTGEFPAGARPDAGQSGGWPSRASSPGAPGGGQSGAAQSGAAAFSGGAPPTGPTTLPTARPVPLAPQGQAAGAVPRASAAPAPTSRPPAAKAAARASRPPAATRRRGAPAPSPPAATRPLGGGATRRTTGRPGTRAHARATRAATPPGPSRMATRSPRPRAPTRSRAGSPGRRARVVRVRNRQARTAPTSRPRTRSSTDPSAAPADSRRARSRAARRHRRPAARRTRRTSCSHPACRPSTRPGSCPATTRTPARSTSARPHRSSRRSRRPGSGRTGRSRSPGSPTPGRSPSCHRPRPHRPRTTPTPTASPAPGRPTAAPTVGARATGRPSARLPTAGRPSADPPLATSWRTRASTPRRRPGPPPRRRSRRPACRRRPHPRPRVRRRRSRPHRPRPTRPPARRTARRTPPRWLRLPASPSPPPRTSPPKPTRDGSLRAERSPTALTSSPQPVCPSAGRAPGSSPAVPDPLY